MRSWAQIRVSSGLTIRFNPWRGCTKVSDGCKNCYAEKLSHRNPALLGEWGDKGTRVIASESMWREPLKWDKAAKAAGERHRVFCASLADVFEDRPELVAPRFRLTELVCRTPNLDWLLLTKRPENIKKIDPSWNRLQDGWPRNVWLGVSVENQEAADTRIPILLTIPAAVRFLSCEPLLGPVSLDCLHHDNITNINALAGRHGINYPLQGKCAKIDWVIAGGESGPNARPMHPEWARSLRDQCQSAGVAFHFKQWGELVHASEFDDVFEGTHKNALPNRSDKQLRVVNLAGGHGFHGDGAIYMKRIGKTAAGRLLDGREWNELPTTKATP